MLEWTSALLLSWAALFQAEGGENLHCPVMPEERIDPDVSAVHDGRRIFFCCERCVRKFEAAPGKYIVNLPAMPTGAESESGAEGGMEPSGLWRVIRFAGRFHPFSIHFPVAFLLGAALFELLFLWREGSFFASAAKASLILGTLGAVAAVGLGWAAYAFADYQGAYTETLDRHKWSGCVGAVLAVLACFLNRRAHLFPTAGNRVAYRIALFSTAVVVGIAGHFGGTLIFGFDHYRW